MDDIVTGFELGAVDYITKPFQSAELLRRVETHISLGVLRRELAEKVTQLTGAMAKLRCFTGNRTRFYGTN